MQLWGFGERFSLPEQGLGRSPSGIEFGAFYPSNMTFGGSNFTNFPENCVTCVGSTSSYGD